MAVHKNLAILSLINPKAGLGKIYILGDNDPKQYGT
jgi:hypothetical protein